jgi:hypothetical protein
VIFTGPGLSIYLAFFALIAVSPPLVVALAVSCDLKALLGNRAFLTFFVWGI